MSSGTGKLCADVTSNGAALRNKRHRDGGPNVWAHGVRQEGNRTKEPLRRLFGKPLKGDSCK